MYGIVMQRGPGVSQYRRLYEQLRDRIISGRLEPSVKLASTRRLARELGLSRSVVLEVVDQLKVEGYLEARRGSGTYVVPNLRLAPPVASRPRRVPPERSADAGTISFLAGTPDPALFPRRQWKACYSFVLEHCSDEEFHYSDPQGKAALRHALAGYLYRTKGIATSPENVIVTAGAGQAFALLARHHRNGTIMMEDPCLPSIRDEFVEHGLTVTPVEVDDEGLVPDRLAVGGADYLYLAPSHQFPLGGTLSAARRVQIVRMLAPTQTVIIEDDYDGEYRYRGHPVAPLHVLAPRQVVYVGTFSKILSPALRLGYMVVPDALVDPLVRRKNTLDLINEGLHQLAMARFIDEGYLERHVRATRRVYEARRNRLRFDLMAAFGEGIAITGENVGLHVVLRLPGVHFSEQMVESARAAGLLLKAVSSYGAAPERSLDGLVIGYARCSPEEISKGVEILRSVVMSESR